MLTASDLNGVLGMIPAFATPDAVDIRATQTIAVDNLKEGVDKIIKDGVNNIATTGTYGECYNLLFDEFKTLAVATVEAIKKRVPLFTGSTTPLKITNSPFRFPPLRSWSKNRRSSV